MTHTHTLTLCWCVAPLWRPAMWQTRKVVLNNTEFWLVGHTDVFIPWCREHICLGALPALRPIDTLEGEVEENKNPLSTKKIKMGFCVSIFAYIFRKTSSLCMQTYMIHVLALPVWNRHDIFGVFQLQQLYPLHNLSLSVGYVLDVEQRHAQLLLQAVNRLYQRCASVWLL